MKHLVLVFASFVFISPVFSFTAGESIPCSENINALQPGYCDGGSHTVTREEIETHERNEEQYRQYSERIGLLRSAGCSHLLESLALCELKDGVLYPYPGAKEILEKPQYAFPKGIGEDRYAGQVLSLAAFNGAGQGPFVVEIRWCGKNPIFAHLNNPVASCDRTAQDIVEWVKWKDKNPAPWLASEGGKYYTWESGAKKEISQEAYNALKTKRKILYNFKTWEEMYNSEKEAKAGTASLKPADSGTRSGNVSNSAGPADPPASGASFGDANYNGVPVDRNIGSASYVVKDAGGGEAYSNPSAGNSQPASVKKSAGTTATQETEKKFKTDLKK